jgi:hypothetical protein
VETLKEAKAWLKERVNEGARCPCCNQLAKVYKRRIHSTMAYHLIQLKKRSLDDSFIHKSFLLSGSRSAMTSLGGGEFAMMRHWGLIEEKLKDDKQKGRTSGFWRITEKGKGFVDKKLLINKFIYLYDGQLLKVSEETASISDCLGEKFDYESLMKGF